MLSTVKYKIACSPTFCKGAFIAKQLLCVMCQIEKKNSVIDGPPTLYSNMLFQFETNANSTNVTPWGQLKLWHDIA